MTIRRSLSLACSTLALAGAAGSAFAQMAAEAPMMAAQPMMAGDMAMAERHIVQVTVENLTTGQGFSPGFFASHAAGMEPLFALGAAASEPLWNVAEGGNIGPYSNLAAGALESHAIGDAVVAVHTPPGATRTFYVTVSEAYPLLSGVWMLGMTNDGFGGFVDLDAWDLTAPVTIDIIGYDAGSERNNELKGFLGALGEGNMRDPENGVVAIHTGIRGDADAPIAWNFDPNLVARVTVTPVGMAP
ncbi:MAG: spondin domain-containing protein [Bauldia sp.]|nr:spondin domain-containing protein [Bauldia sp.]